MIMDKVAIMTTYSLRVVLVSTKRAPNLGCNSTWLPSLQNHEKHNTSDPNPKTPADQITPRTTRQFSNISVTRATEKLGDPLRQVALVLPRLNTTHGLEAGGDEFGPRVGEYKILDLVLGHIKDGRAE